MQTFICFYFLLFVHSSYQQFLPRHDIAPSTQGLDVNALKWGLSRRSGSIDQIPPELTDPAQSSDLTSTSDSAISSNSDSSQNQFANPELRGFLDFAAGTKLSIDPFPKLNRRSFDVFPYDLPPLLPIDQSNMPRRNMDLGSAPAHLHLRNMDLGPGPTNMQRRNMDPGSGPANLHLSNMDLGPGPTNMQLLNMDLGPGPTNMQLRNMDLGPVPTNMQLRNMDLGPVPTNMQLRNMDLGPVPTNMQLRNMDLGPGPTNMHWPNTDLPPGFGSVPFTNFQGHNMNLRSLLSDNYPKPDVANGNRPSSFGNL